MRTIARVMGAGDASRWKGFLAAQPADRRRLVRSLPTTAAAEARAMRQLCDLNAPVSVIRGHVDTAITLLTALRGHLSDGPDGQPP